MIPDNIWQDATGRLLLIGGAHHTSQMFSGERPPSPDTVLTFHENIRFRATTCEQKDIKYSHYVMPDPLVLSQLPRDKARPWKSYYKSYFLDTSGYVVYPVGALIGFADRQLLTDSHYSPIGNAHISANIASLNLGVDAKPILADALKTSSQHSYQGDLAIQCDPRPTEIIERLMPIADLRYSTNGLEKGNNGIIDLIHSPKAITEKTLLVFGDSFLRSMLTELARYWGKIVFFRTPYFHSNIVDAVNPDNIITGMAERYLSLVRPDIDAPDVLAMPLIGGHSTRPSENFGKMFSDLVNTKALTHLTNIEIAASPAWPQTQNNSTIEEQFAFALWTQREGNKSGLTGSDLTDAWSIAHKNALEDARAALTIMHRRGLRIRMA